MDKYELGKMAREAGVNFGPKTGGKLEAFARLVASAERKKYAELCDKVNGGRGGEWSAAANECATSIRACE